MSMKITMMPGAYEGNCIECGKHFIRRQIDNFDDGAFCTRHYKEWQMKTTNIALFSVNHKLPSEGREYACWECLTPSERARHMRVKAVKR